MATEQREVHYSGRVQGVGFRFTACGVAQRYAVTGYVKNLHDGRVQLVAQGEPTELDRFLADLAATMERYISQVDTVALPATERFADFSVRH
jgi:acylphosphatase